MDLVFALLLPYKNKNGTNYTILVVATPSRRRTNKTCESDDIADY